MENPKEIEDSRKVKEQENEHEQINTKKVKYWPLIGILVGLIPDLLLFIFLPGKTGWDFSYYFAGILGGVLGAYRGKRGTGLAVGGAVIGALLGIILRICWLIGGGIY